MKKEQDILERFHSKKILTIDELVQNIITNDFLLRAVVIFSFSRAVIVGVLFDFIMVGKNWTTNFKI